jgi:hypothetical protein
VCSRVCNHDGNARVSRCQAAVGAYRHEQRRFNRSAHDPWRTPSQHAIPSLWRPFMATCSHLLAVRTPRAVRTESLDRSLAHVVGCPIRDTSDRQAPPCNEAIAISGGMCGACHAFPRPFARIRQDSLRALDTMFNTLIYESILALGFKRYMR